MTTASVGLKNVDDIYPLSPLQKGLLFHTLSSPRSGVYLQQFSCVISGDLEVDLFRRTWEGLLVRHAVLRTAFLWNGLDQPLQVVRREVALLWSEEDWRSLSERESETRFERLLELDRERGFDLGKAPLMRFCLRRTGANRWYFAWSFHHILFDGWSLPILLREALQGYEGALRGIEIPWGERRPYRDYVAWLESQDLEKAEAFWRLELRGFKAPTPFVVDKARRPDGLADGYHRLECALAVEETDALQDLARRNQLSLNTVVQGAFAILLARYSRSRDVVFGTTSSGRTPALKGVEEMVGLFINTLPIRVPYDDDLELLSWLRAMQSDHARIREYEYSPLMSIQKWSELAPGTPLFESILVFENYPVDHSPPTAGRSLSVAISSPRLWERTNYPLTIVAAVRGERLSLRAMFDAARLDDSTVNRALTHLLQLFREMAAGSRRLGELRLLSGGERHQVLVEWNDTDCEPSRESTISDLFGMGAAESPEAVALQDGERHLSYRALELESRKLALRLHEIGVSAESRVAVWADRSLEMILGVVGVLKAGAAYVPLDPSYPAERQRFVLQDAEVSAILDPGGSDFEARPSDIPVLSLERQGGDPPSAIDERRTSARGENLAYVLYTSGSTGVPKGVAMPQRPLVNLLSWHLRNHPLSKGTRVLQFASLGFDVSFQEILSTLSAGACLVLLPERARRDAVELLRFLSEARIERVFLPFVALQQLSEVASRGAHPPTALGEIMTAGEQLHLTAAVRAFLSRGASCSLYNHYGPTECHVVTSHRVARDGPNALPPIGRPIWSNQMVILDSCGEPAPIGVPGELYIGGAALARGYLERPEWTAERFVPRSDKGRPGARLYRTGDLARWLVDGELDFLGRSDRQIKVRGFRVEPGEVEGVLEALPSVRHAVVDLRHDRHGLPRLVAYVVLAPSHGTADGHAASADLRQALKARLPSHMIPSSFVVLDGFPLTASGKVDRKALPDPEAVRPELPNAFVAPRTEMERALATVWSEVLGIDRVGIHDNFFELGGDSIVSIQLVAKAQQRQLLLTPTQVFENQTLAELALVVTRSRGTPEDEGPVSGPLPLTPIQRWFFEQDLPEPHHWNMALLLEVQHELDPRRLDATIHRLLVQHDGVRTRFARSREGREVWSARIATAEETTGQQVFEHVDLTALPTTEQASAQERASIELQRSLDLGRGPLLRVVLFRREGAHDRIFLVVHHLVMDGVSWRVLLTDLLAIYEQLSRGREVVLLPRTTSFKYWATRLGERARSEMATEEIDFWTSLARKPRTRLPVDGDGSNLAYSSETVSRSLSADDTRALLTDVPAVYRTQINDVMLTALARTLVDWTGGGDVLFDLEGHGREDLFDDVDLSRTIGWFTALYPVRLSLSGVDGPGSELRSVKEQLRRIPNRGIGYGLLRYLRDDPELAETLKAASPEVSFNYLGQFDQVLPKASPFGVAPESRGGSTNPGGHRAHLIDVTAMVVGGSLQMLWVYSRNVHKLETIEKLAAAFAESLRAIVTHCRDEAVGGCTPSDFPLVSLAQSTLDELVGTGRHVEDIYPLSPLQSGLLFETLYQPNTGAYFEQLSCTFVGDFEVAAFKRSWERMMERHAVLRTRFAWEGLEQPVQLVHRRAVMPWREEDWRSLSDAEQRTRSADFLKEDRAKGFSMREAPVMRAALFRVADDRWQFVWSHHHILLDGWSLQILLKDLILSYESFVNGLELELPGPRRYRDYISWLSQRDRSGESAFWRDALRGVTAPTPLPGASGADETELAGSYEQRSLHLSADETKAIEDFASGHKLTMNTLVEGAWALLLSLYSGEEDVLFGTTVSGRSAELPGIESMIGMFVNTLPVRARVPSDSGLVPWLTELQSQQVQMRRYEHSALVDIHGAGELPRDRPLFESLLVVENYPLDRTLRDRPGGSVSIRDVEFPQRTSYPLTVVAVPRTRLTLYMMYDGARFREAAIVRLLSQMGNLLTGMARDPSRQVLDIPAEHADEGVVAEGRGSPRAPIMEEEFDFGDV